MTELEELQKRNEELIANCAALRDRVTALESRIDALEDEVCAAHEAREMMEDDQ